MKPFKVGDRVIYHGIYGVVEGITSKFCQIKFTDNPYSDEIDWFLKDGREDYMDKEPSLLHVEDNMEMPLDTLLRRDKEIEESNGTKKTHPQD